MAIIIGIAAAIETSTTDVSNRGGGGAFSSTKSLNFDGVDDYVETPAVFSLLDGLSNFAFSFWFKPSNFIYNSIFWVDGTSATANDAQIQLILRPNYLIWYFNSFSYYVYANNNLVADTWYHVLCTRDDSRAINDKARIYINGVNESASDSSRYLGTLDTSTSGLRIGDGVYGPPFLGNIDEFAVYNQDMAAYIDEIYNSGTPADLNNLTTAPAPNDWFRMGEDSTFSSQILMPENTNKDKFSNYSLDFDGVSSYIDTSDATLVNGYTDVTFSGWINVSSLAANWEGILCSRSGSDYILIHIANIVGSTYTLYIQQQNGGGGTYTITHTLSLNFDSWYHFAIMGSVGGKWDMYINGSNAAQVQGSNTIGGITQALSFNIGRDFGGRELVGKIDEVSIFNEVKAIGDLWDGTGKPTDLTEESGLVSWWRMGEDATFSTNWTIPDEIGSNDGTSANMDINDRVGDAPDSLNNALSYNMDEADIAEDTP